MRFQTSQQNSACKFCLQRDLRDCRYAWKSVHFTKCRRHYLVQLQEGCPVPSPFRTRWFRRITTILIGLGNNCGYGEFGYPPPLGARTCPQLSARLRARAGISVLSIRPKSKELYAGTSAPTASPKNSTGSGKDLEHYPQILSRFLKKMALMILKRVFI